MLKQNRVSRLIAKNLFSIFIFHFIFIFQNGDSRYICNWKTKVSGCRQICNLDYIYSYDVPIYQITVEHVHQQSKWMETESRQNDGKGSFFSPQPSYGGVAPAILWWRHQNMPGSVVKNLTLCQSGDHKQTYNVYIFLFGHAVNYFMNKLWVFFFFNFHVVVSWWT